MPQKPRTIHPDDAQDERLASLPLSAALTYAYLPTALDDDGRAKDQPAVFNGLLWPLRVDEHGTDAMAADIAGLVAAGLLCRYTVEGAPYVHDPRWKSRQKIARPVPSTLPRCPTHDRTFDESIADTVGKVSEQVNAFFGAAGPRVDEARVRDSIVRIVEDVTFMVDPERASSYGQKVRGWFASSTQPTRTLRVVADPEDDADREDGPGSAEAADSTAAADASARPAGDTDAPTTVAEALDPEPPRAGTAADHGADRGADPWAAATDEPGQPPKA